MTVTAFEFTVEPAGPFDLLHQNRYFNGWPLLTGTSDTIVMAFPVEGGSGSAAVTLRAHGGQLAGVVHAEPGVDVEAARRQALAALSLDEDGSGWLAVGAHDPVVGALQRRYPALRPTLFHSPYEAAAAFVIGHRISVAQTRAIRVRMSEAVGARIAVGEEQVSAFLDPVRMEALTEFPGVSEVKIKRLHGVAAAARAGRLDRAHLRSLTEPDALLELQTIDGIGPFFARGILYRGAGRADGYVDDDVSLAAARRAYGLAADAPRDQVAAISEGWRPYRSWVGVLLHVAAHEDGTIERPNVRRRSVAA